MGALQKIGVNITTGMLHGDQLTDEGRKAFLQMSSELYINHKTNYDQAINFYKDQAITSGIDPKLILPRIIATSDTEKKIQSKSVVIGKNGKKIDLTKYEKKK